MQKQQSSALVDFSWLNQKVKMTESPKGILTLSRLKYELWMGSQGRDRKGTAEEAKTNYKPNREKVKRSLRSMKWCTSAVMGTHFFPSGNPWWSDGFLLVVLPMCCVAKDVPWHSLCIHCSLFPKFYRTVRSPSAAKHRALIAFYLMEASPCRTSVFMFDQKRPVSPWGIGKIYLWLPHFTHLSLWQNFTNK